MRNVAMKLVVLASFFPTLLTSPVFLIMHLPLPLLRPCSSGNPRGGNVLVFLRPLCISILGQHYACGRHPNSCIPHAVLVSFILVPHVTDLHAKVPATNGVPGSEGTHHVLHAARFQAANWRKVIPFTTKQHIPYRRTPKKEKTATLAQSLVPSRCDARDLQ